MQHVNKLKDDREPVSEGVLPMDGGVWTATAMGAIGLPPQLVRRLHTRALATDRRSARFEYDVRGDVVYPLWLSRAVSARLVSITVSGARIATCGQVLLAASKSSSNVAGTTWPHSTHSIQSVPAGNGSVRRRRSADSRFVPRHAHRSCRG